MMYQGKYEGKYRKTNLRRSRRRAYRGRMTAMALATVLLLALAIGGTVAWLTANGQPITNTFNPSKVTCAVTETFDKTTGVKTNVNVTNTGDIDAYIRVKLVTYRTNAQGQHIGGTATLPQFTLGEGWVEYNGYYYYTKPVAPGGKPAANLTNSMTLTGSYNDADGGKQAIDVMAEAIQSVPAEAVGQVWGVRISPNSVGPYTSGT